MPKPRPPHPPHIQPARGSAPESTSRTVALAATRAAAALPEATPSLLEAAQQEYPVLRAELMHLPAFRRFLILQDFLDEYQRLPPDNPLAHSPPRRRKTNTKRQRFEELATDAIRNNGGHATTEMVFRHLSASGLSVKITTVAWYLSTCPQFIPNRWRGWSLGEQPQDAQHPNPPLVAQTPPERGG